jgi:hypothetical protein
VKVLFPMRRTWARLLRPVLRSGAEQLAPSEHARKEKAARQERAKQQRDNDRIARRAELRALKQRAQAEREHRKQQENARREAERRARAAFDAQAYENYRCVRDWARRLRGADDAAALQLTEAEQQTLTALAPLWDAAPETIANLRHCAEAVSGVRASDYESRSTDLAPRLKREVGFLRKQVGPELFVHEPSALGGFGFSEQGALYNEDTVKFFNVLVALQDAAVLPEYRAATRRRLVWEIGGGWGGFAYQFKCVCPNVTYLITGTPDLFLLSAVYLMTVFPNARCRFYGASSEDLWRDWEDVDFVFAPEGVLRTLQPPRLDLTLDLMALRTMGRRACSHVQRAFDLGSRFFYTLLPPNAAAEPTAEHSCVMKAIDRFYWPHPVPPRRDPKMLAAAASQADALPEPAFGHLVGWRRIRV